MLVYGLSTIYSIFLFRKGFQSHNRVTYLLLSSGFILHTAAMLQRGFTLRTCPITNLYEATMFVGWTLVAAYLVVGLWGRIRFIGAFASPVLFALGVFALMKPLDVTRPERLSMSGAPVSLHGAVILLSYGAFALGSVAGIMYLCQEFDLKRRKFRAVVSLMPPIERLERVISCCLLTGFCLLTMGLAVGAFWLEPPKGVRYWQDPKVHWSAFVWILYLVQLVLHWKFARRGHKFAWGAVGSFAFIILTFWGFSLLSGIHNPAR